MTIKEEISNVAEVEKFMEGWIQEYVNSIVSDSHFIKQHFSYIPTKNREEFETDLNRALEAFASIIDEKRFNLMRELCLKNQTKTKFLKK